MASLRQAAEKIHLRRRVGRTAYAAMAAGTGPDITASIEPPLAPLDEAIFLLHTAAEVEHALMVQYLFALYSLRPECAEWRGALRSTAAEEMGHLVTVQNLLLALGGPLNFEREDFPFRSLYPFPFELEPLSLSSLAKYTLAEKPDREIDPSILSPELLAEIGKAAVQSNEGMGVSPVGRVYARLIEVVESIPEESFRKGREGFMATLEEWPGAPARITQNGGAVTDVGPGFVILPVTNRQEAVVALQAIAIQGEGATSLETNADAHFRRFLDVYKAARTKPGPIAFPVPVNPQTGEGDGPSTISYAPTKMLAQLANLRYRFLLTSLHHLMLLDRTSAGPQRAALRDWATEEMLLHLGDAAALLARMPRVNFDDLSSRGAMPFELPYTFAMPSMEADRWRLLGLILEASRNRIGALRDENDFAKLDTKLCGDLSRFLMTVEEDDAARAETIRKYSE
jgi:hypothetical protein